MKLALAVLLLTGCEPPPFSPVDRTPAPRTAPKVVFRIAPSEQQEPRIILRRLEFPFSGPIIIIHELHPPEPTVRL